MTTGREFFLDTVRKAVAAGNPAGHSYPVPARAAIGYQGGGQNLADRFATELQTAGGRCYRVDSVQKAVRQVAALLHTLDARRIVLGGGGWLDVLELASTLTQIGLEVWQENGATPRTDAKETLFQADAGVTGADWLIAETGSIVVASRPGQARSLSLLPPIHIAIAETAQLVPDLFDLFERCAPTSLPANLTLITGPSKTGDIELKLVTGVHGPREVHVILVEQHR